MNSVCEEIIKNLSVSSGLDHETCELVLETYIDQSKEIVAGLKELLQAEDYGKLKDLFHKLKGSSGNVRFEEVRVLSEEAEGFARSGDAASLKEQIAKIDVLIQSMEA